MGFRLGFEPFHHSMSSGGSPFTMFTDSMVPVMNRRNRSSG